MKINRSRIILTFLEPASFSAALVAAIFIFKLGWFTHIIIGLGVISMWFLIHFRWSKRTKTLGLMKPLIYIIFFGIFIITQITIWKGFIGIEKNTTFEMAWSYAEISPSWPDSKHIILKVVKYPNHQIGIYSNNLGDYLESLPTEYVNVEFRTTWDFGKLRGYYQTKIGTLTKWNSAWSYGETSGDYYPAPWDNI